MFGWGKNKNKQKNKSTKPRAAPAAHRHPHYKKNAPRPPTVSASSHISPQVKYQNNNRSQSQSQQITPRRQQSNPQKQNKTPPTNITNDNDDDDDSESEDMFGGMDVADEDDDADSEPTKTPQKVDTKPPKRRGRTMSVEELNKLSEKEQLDLALQLSLGTNESKAPKQVNKPMNDAPITQTITKKADISQPIQSQQVVDKANIEWPSIPTQKDNNIMESMDNNNENDSKQASSAFGFDLSGSAPTDDVNSNTQGNDTANSSAFGFDLSGNNLMANANGSENVVVHNDEDDEEEDMFGNMNISSKIEDDHISSIMSASTQQPTDIREIATPSYGTTNATTASPPPSASLGPVDTSVLSQLKRAEQQHERSRKRIWSQIKQCLDREQRIKQRETELRDKLIVENNKKMDAENNKISALKNADFELAEKTKNIIRRSMKNIQDVNHQLAKYEQDIKKIKYDKTNEEEKYMKKNKSYREKLKLLYDKHEQNMTKNIQDEFKRIEREEKTFKEKLERTEREIQLDEENIEKCKERMEEIEDLIKTDVEPFQENLDKKNSEKSCLLLEIDELNKQLNIKKNELLGVENNISELNNEIMKVRKIYSDQMDEIIGEQSRYEQSKDKFTLQKNGYALKLNYLNNDSIKNKQSETEFEDELNALKLKISKINDSFERFQEKKQRHTEWINEEKRLLENKKKLNKKMEIVKYEIEKYEKEIKQIESKCIQHRSTISTIDSALPILHSDKTTAVNNENYLEAGKIHKQILHKTSQKEKSMEQLKALNDKTLKIKEKFRSEQTAYEGMKQELSDIKIKLHRQRFDLIMDERGIIKESINASQFDESNVESIVLNLELDQIELELDFFKKQYGWNVTEKVKKNNNEINSLDDVIGSGSGTMSPNNAEPVDTLMNQIEKKKQENNEVIVKQKRKRNDIENEMEKCNDEIIQKTNLKEETQSEINKAVANEEYEKAGSLAPKKKRLVSEINELKKKVEQLQVELNEVIEEEEKEKEKEKEMEKENDSNDNPGDTIEGDNEVDDMNKEEVNGMDGYGMMGGNDGYNGIMDKDNEKEKDNINTNNNEDIKINENDAVDKLTTNDTNSNEDNNNDIIDNDKEVNEINDNNNEEVMEDIVNNDNDNEEENNENNEDGDDDENTNDMFGGMVVGDDEQDTVNID